MLIGRLGKDAETRFTPGGAAVTNFTIATSRRSKDSQTGEWKDDTDWHDVVLWRGENISQYLQKGRQIYVEGRLQTRQWDDKDGNKRYTTEIKADRVTLLGGGSGGRGVERGSGSASSHDEPPMEPMTDDDIPF